MVNEPPPVGRPELGADVTVGADGGADMNVPPLYVLDKPIMFDPLITIETMFWLPKYL